MSKVDIEYDHDGKGYDDEGEALSDILNTRHRIYNVLKIMNFIVVIWYIAGSLLPQHNLVKHVFGYNGSLLTTYIVFISGMLTHLRYRYFIIRNPSTRFWSTANHSMYEYLYSRVLKFLPLYSLVYVYGLCLQFAKSFANANYTIGYGANILRNPVPLPNILSIPISLSLMSSWFNFQPFINTTYYLTPLFTSFTLIASLLFTCWILYPVIARTIIRVTANHKLFTYTLLILFTIVIETVYTVFAYFYASQFTLQTTLDQHRLLFLSGIQVEFLNPIFKLPMFLLGVLTCEAAYQLGWTEENQDETPADADLPIQKEYTFFESWIAPYLFDAFFVFLAMFSAYDPLYQSEATWYARLTTFGAASAWKFETWTAVSQFACLKLLVPTMLLALSPRIHRSLFSKLFCLDPIMYVFPGRAGWIMSLIYIPFIFTIPDDWSAQIQAGGGFFFFISTIFMVTLALYYYVFEPLNIWLSIRVACGRLLTEESGRVPTLKIIRSPNYDRFNLKDDNQELAAYKHLSEVSAPRSLAQLPRWVKQVFVDVHAYSD